MKAVVFLLCLFLPKTSTFITPLRLHNNPIPSLTLFSEKPKRRIRKDRANVPSSDNPPASSPPPRPSSSLPAPEPVSISSSSSISNSNSNPTTTTTSTQTTQNNDFSSLLKDSEKFRSSSKALTADEKIGDELSQKIKSAISTLITIDFFLILAFLAWFVTGVISSTVFKNDVIQIAFNGIFQPLVQPALGILMIGSVAGGAFGKDEKDDD
ncbi:hypothetical protein TrVE_jg8909 [Triparma verrucosa]|uniref:Transmembrane protein n=1 Tax=Triparma verrucosa TaxID=1606542 RepID=A0A9W7BKI8_9STRA|nr:hypothetical protein TrVE_jg8909 [Triparma verrucosa]